MKSIQAMRAGGVEVLEFNELPTPKPAQNQLLVQVHAAGINFIDTYLRSGVYKTDYPHIPGSEGSGIVTDVGPDVSADWIGKRVAWVQSPGSYTSHKVLDLANALEFPDSIDLNVAAALPLQGMTAHYLATSSYPIHEGDTVVVHAAAGGVGLILTQLAKHRGATVIGTVSTDAKAQLAREAGVDHIIRYDSMTNLTDELTTAIRDIASDGVHAVYDGVGKSTFDASLASLRPRGTMVLFGGASGQVPPFDLQRLNALGSLFITRPTLAHHIATHQEKMQRWNELLDLISAGKLKIDHISTYPLAEAAQAQTDLENRQTVGKVLLLP